MDSDVVQLHNGTRLVTDITEVILKFCRDRGDGLCHVFVPHATAGVCARVGASPCHITSEITVATVSARPSRFIIS